MKKAIRWYWLFLWPLVLPPVVEAQIYKVVMPDGRVVYTDTPPEGAQAEQVELPELIIQPATRPRDPQAERTNSAPAPIALPTPEITQPQEQQVIPPGQRQVNIIAQVERGLPGGYRYLLLLNGAPVGAPVDTPTWLLENPNPGEQRAQVAIVDANGRRVVFSALRIFYVIR